VNTEGQENNRIRRLNSGFMKEFEDINTILYKKYIILKDNSCPICLGEYQEDEIIKILPV